MSMQLLLNQHVAWCRQQTPDTPPPPLQQTTNDRGVCEPSSKVWHRCRFKPPNCRLAWAARVVCAQPGTVVCSQTPLSLVVCRSGGGGGVGWGWGCGQHVDSKVIA